jgi:hypothetical protein
MRKMHLKLRQIYDFELYELDQTNNLKTRDIQDLIDALNQQHSFIHEAETM